MYNKRNRFKVHSTVSSITSAIARIINPVNTIRMQKTLDLEGVDTKLKPHINDIMPFVEERLDEEERQRNIRIARQWAKSGVVLNPGLFDGADYGFEDEEDYFAYLRNHKKLQKKNKKESKRGSRGRGKNKRNDGYSYGLDYGTVDPDDFWEHRRALYGDDFEDDEDNDEKRYKHIYFYPDINDEGNVKEFYSLSDFNDFCGKNNYLVGSVDFENLKNWGVIHCCLDPVDLEYGDNTVITDNSYGGLYWTVEPDLSKSGKAS